MKFFRYDDIEEQYENIIVVVNAENEKAYEQNMKVRFKYHVLKSEEYFCLVTVTCSQIRYHTSHEVTFKSVIIEIILKLWHFMYSIKTIK